MRLVVDANIIFSAILKNGLTRKLLLDDRLTLYAPFFLKEEIIKYKRYLSRKRKITESEFLQVIEELLVLANIEFVDLRKLSSYINVARRISPDPKDALYVALAIFEACPIWSNDKSLRETQDLVQVISTTEIYKTIQSL